MNAVSADRLDAANVTDTAGLQTTVPSLNIATSAGSSFVYVRGVGSNVFGSFTDNSVATYVDGVYIPRNTYAIQELFDVDRVEVLRGPQATLYGRNATGGVILISTAAPTDTVKASADFQVGNHDSLRARGMISGPLVDGLLSARFSAVRSKHAGYSKDLGTGQRYDDKDFWAVRGALRATPAPNLTITLSGNYSKENGAPGTIKAIDPNAFPFVTTPAGPGAPFSADPRASYYSVVDSNPMKSYGGNLRVALDTSIGVLQTNTAYNRYRLGPTVLDLDDSIVPLLEYRGQLSTTDFFYQDITLTSKPGDSRFDWLLGFTYADEDTGGLLPVLTPGGLSSTISGTKVKSYAGYAELGFRISRQLRIVGGLRYSSEERFGTSARTIAGTTATGTNRKKWTDWSPRASLEFRPADDILVYASATRGFKSGAFDPQNVASAANPESIWNYELGLRTQFFDRRLTLNATAFHYDYRDLQIFNGLLQGTQVLTFLQNAGRAKVDGLELEGSFLAVEGVRIGGTLSFLNGRYSQGTVLADLANAIPGRPPATPAIVQYLDVGGNRMIQSTRFTGTAFVEIEVPLGSVGRLQFYADYFRQSRRYFTAFEDPTVSAPAYDTINARLTYHLPGDNIYIAAYVRNAGNTLVTSIMSRQPPFGTTETYAPPRLTGIEVGFRF